MSFAMQRGHDPSVNESAGFSLLELLIAMTILLVVLGTVLSVLARYQQIYQAEQLKAGVEMGLNSALDLMNQEIGQAGYLGFAPRTLLAPVTEGTLPQTAPVSSTDSMFTGEKLLVDAGSTSQEVVTVQSTGAGDFTAVFRQSHSSGAPVTALGVFGTGILPTSSGNTLQLYGDVNDDDTVDFVQYACDAAAGVLTRSVTPIGAASQAPAQPLLTGLMPNGNGAPCFQYATKSYLGSTYVTAVKVTLTSRASMSDMQQGQPPEMTAVLTVAPRNVMRALAFAEMIPPKTDLLEPTPLGLPLP